MVTRCAARWQAALYSMPGKSHGDSQDAAYRYPGMFKWMLEQRRTKKTE
jgi:hypothetical protein